uniref:Uncharacterized protein n=1 Tax=Romanomermis culicivorax TaxID=13658 RepID=A0A915IR87_ROMCU
MPTVSLVESQKIVFCIFGQDSKSVSFPLHLNSKDQVSAGQFSGKDVKQLKSSKKFTGTQSVRNMNKDDTQIRIPIRTSKTSVGLTDLLTALIQNIGILYLTACNVAVV